MRNDERDGNLKCLCKRVFVWKQMSFSLLIQRPTNTQSHSLSTLRQQVRTHVSN